MRESLLASRMTQSLVSDPNERGLRLWLLSANTIHGVTYYRIVGRFTSTGQTWEVSHRYSEFLKLRDQLVKFLSTSTDKCPGCRNYLHSIQRFDFPKKHLFASRAPPVVNYRVKALRSFINLLASWAFSKTPKCPTCGGYAFDIVRNFVLDGDALSADTDMNSIRESMTVKAFAEPNMTSSRGSMQTRDYRFMSTGSSGDLDLTQSMYLPKGIKQSKPSEDLSVGKASPPQLRQHETPGQKLPAKDTKNHHQSSNEQRRQQQRSRYQDEEDPYDVFNDYLPTKKQSKLKKPVQASMEEKIQSGKFKSRPLHESIEEGKQRRHEENEARVSQQTLRKHRSEPRNLSARRVLAESELSVGTSAFESPHSSKNVTNQTGFNAESYKSDGSMVAETIVVHGDEIAHHEFPDNGKQIKSTTSSVYSDDDEIELTGVAMASSPRAIKNKGGVDNLWQPWELARVA